MIDTLPADTMFIVEAPPPTVNETYETIFDRRRATGSRSRDVPRAYSDSRIGRCGPASSTGRDS
jgi:hypothetical protein